MEVRCLAWCFSLFPDWPATCDAGVEHFSTTIREAKNDRQRCEQSKIR
jgi:hypothetical protein